MNASDKSLAATVTEFVLLFADSVTVELLSILACVRLDMIVVALDPAPLYPLDFEKDAATA